MPGPGFISGGAALAVSELARESAEERKKNATTLVKVISAIID
jgi:hypothetical protein